MKWEGLCYLGILKLATIIAEQVSIEAMQGWTANKKVQQERYSFLCLANGKRKYCKEVNEIDISVTVHRHGGLKYVDADNFIYIACVDASNFRTQSQFNWLQLDPKQA